MYTQVWLYLTPFWHLFLYLICSTGTYYLEEGNDTAPLNGLSVQGTTHPVPQGYKCFHLRLSKIVHSLTRRGRWVLLQHICFQTAASLPEISTVVSCYIAVPVTQEMLVSTSVIFSTSLRKSKLDSIVS